MLPPLVLIMTLSHGQAEVEKSFNNNSLVLKDDLKIGSIVASNFMNSYVIQKEIQPHEMQISPQLMKSVSQHVTGIVFILKNRRKTKQELSF